MSQLTMSGKICMKINQESMKVRRKSIENLRLQDDKNVHIKRHQMVNQMKQIGIEDLRVEKMQQKKIQKLKQYKMILLESKITKLSPRLTRKLSHVDMLLHSYQNGMTPREELSHFDIKFQQVIEIHEEMKRVNDQYIEEF